MATAKQIEEYRDDPVKADRERSFEELMDWMRDNGARHIAQFKAPASGKMDFYSFAGTTVIVHTYGDGNGWEFYAPVTGEMTWEGTKAALAKMLGEK